MDFPRAKKQLVALLGLGWVPTGLALGLGWWLWAGSSEQIIRIPLQQGLELALAARKELARMQQSQHLQLLGAFQKLYNPPPFPQPSAIDGLVALHPSLMEIAHLSTNGTRIWHHRRLLAWHSNRSPVSVRYELPDRTQLVFIYQRQRFSLADAQLQSWVLYAQKLDRHQRTMFYGFLWGSIALMGGVTLSALLWWWLWLRPPMGRLLQLRERIKAVASTAGEGVSATASQELPATAVSEGVSETAVAEVFDEPKQAEVDIFEALQRDIEGLLVQLQEQQQNEVFREQVARWQDIARRLAHEIKNPLTPILLATQELHRQYKGDDARYRRTLDSTLEIVQEEVEALRRLVEEFSAFAKLPEVRLQATDVGRLVEEFLGAYDGFKGQAKVSYEGTTEPIYAQIDRMLMKRVLYNLVQNAIEAGSPEVILRLGLLPMGQCICQVEDRGPGIPEHLQSKIFTPYFTTKQFGTGLGLSITKKIVLDHGGKIKASSNAQGGATISIFLPVSTQRPVPSKIEKVSL